MAPEETRLIVKNGANIQGKKRRRSRPFNLIKSEKKGGEKGKSKGNWGKQE